MSIRTRTQDIPIPSGNEVNNLTLVTKINSSSFLSERHRNVDEVKVGDNGSLTIDHMKMEGGVRSGTTTPTGRYTYNNRIVTGVTSAAFGHIALGGPTNAAYAAKLLALTSPSRPVVDLPVFVAELKDVPELFKVVGKSILRTIAKGNLTYQFGIRPLANDLKSLMNFAGAVHNRTRELEKFYSSGLSRTRSLDSLSGSAWSNEIFDPTANEGQWRAILSKVTTQEVWGHVKWRPTSLPPKTDAEMVRLATRAAFGLTIDFKTAWELIPFSWLVDWCSSVGDYLSSQRNIVPAQPYDLSIMRLTKTDCSCQNTIFNPGAPPSPLTVNIETKTRSPSSASLSAHLPFLSLRQMSILGSLAVLRLRHRGGILGT